jgi:hypothetical protein
VNVSGKQKELPLKTTTMTLSAALIACLTVVGCGRENTPTGGASAAAPSVATPQTEVDKARFLLAAEPAGAKGVRDARNDAKDGDDVVMVGRIGGEKQPWVEGRAAFRVVDAAFKPCNEREDDGCKTPWDYCCDDTDELHKGMATVKVVDSAGKTVPVDARELLGVKELQTVVVKGKAKRDVQGNLTVLASGLYVRR